MVDSVSELPGAGSHSERHSYNGVGLILGGETILRVFVNHDGAGAVPIGASRAFVSAAVPRVSDGTLRPIGGAVPAFGPSAIPAGPAGLVKGVRGDPMAAFTFILPRSWHDEIAQAPDGALELRISISGGFRECSGCGADNVVIVDHIRFRSSPHNALVQPIEIVYRNSANKLMRPRPADEIFSGIEKVIPHAQDGLRVSPFIGQVDATDLIRARDAGSMTDDQVQSAVFGRVADFARGANPPDRKVIGVMAPGMNIRGLEAPVTFCCDFKPLPMPRWEPIAIAAEDRPMLSLLHEYLHQHGLYHGGLYCNADLAIGWPPDNKGELQGFGLDRRTSMRDPLTGAFRLLTPSASKPYHDVMSYCATDEDDSWISPRNWNALGGAFPNGALPDSLFLGQATATVNAESGVGMVNVTGTAHPDGSVTNLVASHQPGQGYSYSANSSPYEAVAFGPGDMRVGSGLMYAPPAASEKVGLRYLNATIKVSGPVTEFQLLAMRSPLRPCW